MLGVGVETVGTDAGQAGDFDPPFPNHTIMHGAGKFGLASLAISISLPARRDRDRRAAQDRERQRQSASRAGDRAVGAATDNSAPLRTNDARLAEHHEEAAPVMSRWSLVIGDR